MKIKVAKSMIIGLERKEGLVELLITETVIAEQKNGKPEIVEQNVEGMVLKRE